MSNYFVEAWLSGGAGNTDPEAALGGARSTAQRTGQQDFDNATPHTGITVVAVDFNGPSAGTFTTRIRINDNAGDAELELDDAPSTFYVNTPDKLTAPSGVVNGDLKRRDGSDYRNAWMRVTADFDTIPVPGAPPEYSADIVVTTPQDTLYSIAQAAWYAAGRERYRCFYILNNTGSSMTGFDLASNSGDLEFGFDAAGVNGVATTVVDDVTAPVGVTFGTFDSLPTLANGDFIAVWTKHIIPAAYVAFDAFQIYTLNLTDAVDTRYFFNFNIAYELTVPEEFLEEDLILTDEIVGEGIYPVESLDFTDEITASKILTEDLTETLVLTDDVANYRLVSEALDEVLAFTEEIHARGVFSVALTEELILTVQLRTGGETYEGWTLNIETDASSRYLWEAFNSFAEFNGRYYGASDSGIHELVGDTDAGEPIEAFILTGVRDHGDPREKRATRAYVGIRANGTMLLKTVTDENVVSVYELVSTSGELTVQRVKLAQGLESVYWQYGLQNADGADFEAESIKVLPIVLTRRFD